ncbi:hypothetical protein MTO96_009707 [Rhipicephalus appendiculatus]
MTFYSVNSADGQSEECRRQSKSTERLRSPVPLPLFLSDDSGADRIRMFIAVSCYSDSVSLPCVGSSVESERHRVRQRTMGPPCWSKSFPEADVTTFNVCSPREKAKNSLRKGLV